MQLPGYSPALYELGKSDYPTDVLEKVASVQLRRWVGEHSVSTP